MDTQQAPRKILNYGVSSLSLCDENDLAALLTDEDMVIIKRISHVPQNITKIEDVVEPSSLSFKNNGSLLAIGTRQGNIHVYKIESSSAVLIAQLHELHTSPVSKISWIGGFSPRPISKTVNEYIPRASNQTIDYLESSLSHLSFMVSHDIGKIVLSSCGLLPFATISLDLPGGSEIIESRLSPDFATLHAVAKTPDSIAAVTISTILLSYRKQEIFEMTYYYTYVSEIMEELKAISKTLAQEWRTISRQFFMKFIKPIEDPNGEISVSEVYLQAVGTGIAPDNLHKYIKEYISSYKILVNFDEKFTTMMTSLMTLVQNRFQPLVERLNYALIQISAMSKNAQKYAPLGVLDTSPMVGYASELYRGSDKLLTGLAKGCAYVKNFIIWLNKKAFKNVKQEENERNPLFVTKCNNAKLIKFLQHPNLFTLSFIDSVIAKPDELDYEIPEASCYKLPGEANLSLETLSQAILRQWTQIFAQPIKCVPKMFATCNITRLCEIPRGPPLVSIRFAAKAVNIAVRVEDGVVLFGKNLEDYRPGLETSTYELGKVQMEGLCGLQLFNDQSLAVFTNKEGLGFVNLAEVEPIKLTEPSFSTSIPMIRSQQINIQQVRSFSGQTHTMSVISGERRLAIVILDDKEISIIDLDN